MVEEEVKIKATLTEMPLRNDSESGEAYQTKTTSEWSEGRSCTGRGDDECKNLQS
jgi:hypothetical protein